MFNKQEMYYVFNRCKSSTECHLVISTECKQNFVNYICNLIIIISLLLMYFYVDYL